MLLFFGLAVGLGIALYHAVGIAKEYLANHGLNIKAHLKQGFDKVLLVTAHPDDECMFFAPTIRAFFYMGIPVHVLCLSTGDHEGLGAVRSGELKESCSILGIGCTIINDERFPDGPHRWDPQNVANAIGEFLKGKPEYKTLLTFDRYGVSGHTNHCDVSTGVLYFATRSKSAHFTILELESVPLLVKYLGPLGIIYEYIQALIVSNNLMLTRSKAAAPPSQSQTTTAAALGGPITMMMDSKGYQTSLSAMSQHSTQLVWFRYLYIIFSRYMFINTLIRRTPINPPN